MYIRDLFLAIKSHMKYGDWLIIAVYALALITGCRTHTPQVTPQVPLKSAATTTKLRSNIPTDVQMSTYPGQWEFLTHLSNNTYTVASSKYQLFRATSTNYPLPFDWTWPVTNADRTNCWFVLTVMARTTNQYTNAYNVTNTWVMVPTGRVLTAYAVTHDRNTNSAPSNLLVYTTAVPVLTISH
jgi:hypothetical protein